MENPVSGGLCSFTDIHLIIWQANQKIKMLSLVRKLANGCVCVCVFLLLWGSEQLSKNLKGDDYFPTTSSLWFSVRYYQLSSELLRSLWIIAVHVLSVRCNEWELCRFESGCNLTWSTKVPREQRVPCGWEQKGQLWFCCEASCPLLSAGGTAECSGSKRDLVQTSRWAPLSKSVTALPVFVQ